MAVVRFKRTKSRCSECPLRDRHRVWSRCDIDSPSIAVLGEAPGQDEDNAEGRLANETDLEFRRKEKGPFIGAAGNMFKYACGKAGLMWHTIWKMNVICCRPPDNDISSDEAKKAIECCKPGLEQEIEYIRSLKAKVVVPVGNTALAALGIDGKISGCRGSVYPLGKGLIAVPTYHPSYILRGAVREEPVWIADLHKAFDLSLKTYKAPKERFNIYPTLEEVEAFAKAAVEAKTTLYVDIEHHGGFNTDWNKITMIGFGTSSEDVMVVPFTKNGKFDYWMPGDELRVWKAIRSMLAHCPTVYQHALHDVYQLEMKGHRVGNIAHDTLLCHHCLVGTTEIDTLDFGRVPISTLVGKRFWVVSHNGASLVPKPAKVCWSAGKRTDLFRVVFWCKDRMDKTKMWIDCTGDHEIPTWNRGKVKARYLAAGDRLYRGQLDVNRISGKRIHRWVYEQITGESLTPEFDIHHKDGNHFNNSPDNLEKLLKSKHSLIHKDGRYRATMRLVQVSHERRSAKVSAKDVIMHHTAGLSHREIALELNVAPHLIQAVLKQEGLHRSRSEALKLRWEKHRNCRVIAVVPLASEGEEVFDIEVPGTHTFSANGVIVGNSIHPELKHDLEYITSVYGETPAWKDVMKGAKTHMIDKPDDQSRTYNARDTAVLAQILPPMLEDLKAEGVERTYFDVSMKLVRPFVEMMKNGIKVDPARLKELKRNLLCKETKILKRLYSEIGLPESFNFDSPEQVRYLLYGAVPDGYEKAVREKLEIEANPKRSRTTKKYLDLVDKVRRIDETKPLYKTKSMVDNTDEEALLGIKQQALNRLSAIDGLVKKNVNQKKEEEDIERLLLFISLFLEWSGISKQVSTYTKYPLLRDGRVHTSLGIHGTATGRPNSRDPNLLNVPKDVRKIFVPEKGNCLVQGDYKNLEVFVLGFLTEEPFILDAFKKGISLHDMNAEILFNVKTVKEGDKGYEEYYKFRQAAKKFSFGLNYGGGIQGIYRKILLEVPDFKLSFAAFTQCYNDYFRKLPKYAEWRKLVQDTVTGRSKEELPWVGYRWIRNAFGRKRLFLGAIDEIEREALNTPIQGTAADVTNPAIIEFYRLSQTPRWKPCNIKLLLTVYDSILVECPIKHKMEVAQLLKDVMEKDVVINGKKRHFVADIEASDVSWGEMTKLKLGSKGK
jgi:uracil-DNA glycosylase family 4